MNIKDEKEFAEFAEFARNQYKRVILANLKFYVNRKKKTIVAKFGCLTAVVKLADGDVWSEYAGKMAAVMKLYNSDLFKTFMKAETIYHGEQPKDEKHNEPAKDRKESTRGEIVGDLSKPKEDVPFLYAFLKERKFSNDEAAQLCNVGKSAISRARYGYRLRKESFNQIVKGLEMTPEEAKEFKKSLRRKQDNYHVGDRK